MKTYLSHDERQIATYFTICYGLAKQLYDGQLVVDKDSMEEVARMVLEDNCFGCSKCDWRECGLYNFMKKLGMGSTNDTEGKCEFWYDEL